MEAEAGQIIVEESQDQCGNEKAGGCFAPVVGMNNNVLFPEKEQGTDNHGDFLDDHQDDGRPGKYVAPPVADQGGHDQQFICERIHKFSEGSNLIVFPGKVSVEHVSQAGKTENTEGLIGMAVEIKQNEKRNEHQTEHR